MTNWTDYYEMSLKQNEGGLFFTKDQWFNDEYQKWQQKNQGKLE